MKMNNTEVSPKKMNKLLNEWTKNISCFDVNFPVTFSFTKPNMYYRKYAWGKTGKGGLIFPTFLQREEEITNNPLSKPEEPVEQTAAELLYAAMLPSLPQVSFL